MTCPRMEKFLSEEIAFRLDIRFNYANIDKGLLLTHPAGEKIMEATASRLTGGVGLKPTGPGSPNGKEAERK